MRKFLEKNKPAIWIYAISAILFAGFIFADLNYQKSQTLGMDKQMLQTLANDKAAEINLFFEFQKQKLLSLASMDAIKEAFLHPDDALKLDAAKKIIDGLGGTAALFTANGILVYATNAPSGVDYSGDSYFLKKDKNIFFGRYYDKYEKKDFYIVIGPVYGGQEKDKAIGAIGFHIPLEEVSNLMKENLNDSNEEVYLIDGTGLLLSASKYIGQGDKNGILVQQVQSDGAEDCLNDLKKFGEDSTIKPHQEEVTEYLNYMGEEVYGTHSYAPAIMGCVIAEEKKDSEPGFSAADLIKSIFNN